jgi:hypothetical protein
MPESLEEVKNRLRQSYLGRGGVHAVGVSRAEQAIRVYVSPEAAPEQPEVLAQLRESARPFAVIVVREDRARIT